MLQRLVLLTSWMVTGSVMSAAVAQATTMAPLVEPLPPEITTPVVVPTGVAPPTVAPILAPISAPPTTLPILTPEIDSSLPDGSHKPLQPWYHEQPIKPAQLPLRLEIKLSRRRVTVYRGKTPVKTYPIAVGRPGWETPKGTYKVQQMFRNPTWIHPLKRGITIPGGDPENPLGRYWIGFWTDGKNWIGFHGTPNPKSVGTAASHGCVRMYNDDIEELFKKVSLGTEVRVVQ